MSHKPEQVDVVFLVLADHQSQCLSLLHISKDIVFSLSRSFRILKPRYHAP